MISTRQALKERFEHFDQMINDPEHKDALAAGPVYQLVSQIMPATKRVIATFEDMEQEMFQLKFLTKDILKNRESLFSYIFKQLFL